MGFATKKTKNSRLTVTVTCKLKFYTKITTNNWFCELNIIKYILKTWEEKCKRMQQWKILNCDWLTGKIYNKVRIGNLPLHW